MNMIYDKIEKFGKSVFQHGKSNDRIYLMKLVADDCPQIIAHLDILAAEHQYSKIFAKVPQWAKEAFASSGYIPEARIPAFYNGQDDVYFMAKYPDPVRGENTQQELTEEIIHTAKNIVPKTIGELDSKFSFSVLCKDDIKELAAIYQTVFETYPFPIHDPAYLAETMEEHIIYFGIRENGRLVAVSSCETDLPARNVEMTDFATLPDNRSQGLASFLLAGMEREMKKRGFMTAYTIARAVSYGMNITFAKNHYTFSGTLMNNTNISGGLENMNVWYKKLV